jgi:nitroreductase
MQQRLMSEKPSKFPATQPDGAPLKPITQVLLDRRATMRFKPDETVSDEYIDAILSFGAQAPSGFNLQPWRFIVVRDEENRKRLSRAAMNQVKVTEAPVVIWNNARTRCCAKARGAAPANLKRWKPPGSARCHFFRPSRWASGSIAIR